jgi:hypothetical protein
MMLPLVAAYPLAILPIVALLLALRRMALSSHSPA